jgi:dTDP-D-glucose 4,6-dehydratase
LHALGWSAQTPFDEGIKQAYDWYVANAAVSEASSANVR